MLGNKFALRLFSVLTVALFIVVFVRLFHLQVIEGARYSKFVNSQISAKLSVTKNRGVIYDRDGNVIVRNKSTASLYAFKKKIPNLKTFVNKLNASGISVNEKTKKQLSSKDSFVWIKRRVELDKAEKLVKSIDGLEYFKEEARFYPQGALLSSVVGFTGVDNEGLSGLEYSLDKDLGGSKVTIASLRDSRGKLILFDDKTDVLKPDSEIYLTVPYRVQASAEYLLRKGAERFGAKDGSAIAIDVKTGEILMVANVKSFDPANYSNYPSDSWQSRAFSYVFEPGSIFKSVSFAYLYDSKRLDRSKMIDTANKITIGGYTYSDTKNFGILSVDDVFTRSSNIGTAALMRNESNKDYYTFLKQCGFGSKVGVFGVSEEAGRLKDSSLWSQTSRTSIGIGYEVMVTPLQMVRFYGAIANGGIAVDPRLISKIVKDDGEKIFESEKKRIMKKETADYLLALMTRTVEDGTGKNAESTIVKIAGKTGTASIYDHNTKQYSKQHYSASFAGVFPANNPKVAMVVVYESPSSSIYGGSTAANIFRQLAEYLTVELNLSEPVMRAGL